MIRALLSGASIVALLASACATPSGQGGVPTSAQAGVMESLTRSLTGNLGVSPSQAMGGVGSMLSYAQSKLTPSQFQGIAKALPGAESSIEAAKSLGAAAGPITDKVGLTSAFSKLGMGSDMVSKFVPVVSDAISKSGGADLAKQFAGLF
jgi:hypothetical protein